MHKRRTGAVRAYKRFATKLRRVNLQNVRIFLELADPLLDGDVFIVIGPKARQDKSFV